MMLAVCLLKNAAAIASPATDKARMPEMLSKTTWEKVKTDLEKLVVRGLDV
jgi:hypothetical protein